MWVSQISGTPTAVGLQSALWMPCKPACVHGVCHNGTCFCDARSSGPACENVKCDYDCWQRGTCEPNGTCVCDTYWSTGGSGEYQLCFPEDFLTAGNCRDAPAHFDTRSNCSIVACKDDCSGHGVCTQTGCVCSIGWSGGSCAQPPCPFNCRSHGVCSNGTCVCRPGFVGNSCEWPLPRSPPPANSPGCPRSRPFYCDVTAACVIALGECAAHRAAKTRGVWEAAPYSVLPLTAQNGTQVTASSSLETALNVIEGGGLFWQSGQCYPLGYVENAQTNILLGACAAGRCQSTAVAVPSLAAATDGDATTAVDIPAVSGTAWATFALSPPAPLAAVSLRVQADAGVVSVIGLTAAGQRVPLGNVTSSGSQTNLDLVNGPTFVSVRLESAAVFSLFELSARSGPCSEFVTVDLGRVVAVAALTVRHWAGVEGVNETLYEASEDGVEWIVLRGSLPPLLMGELDTVLSPAVSLRYLRVRHVLQERTSVKVYVWEVTIWDEWGKYGQRSAAAPNPVSLRDLLGVDGIWGWGAGGLTLPPNVSYGPGRFSGVASHARDYHNWNWDTDDPNTPPPYDEMVPPGSVDFGVLPGYSGALAQDWLNWDPEYTSWNQAGLPVEASIQFTPSMFPQSLFRDPYADGYRFGFAFARHFGPTNGTGDVVAMECGNEPWVDGSGYADPVFYSDVLLGMARGAKNADPQVQFLPATLQFGWENEVHIRFINTRVLDESSNTRFINTRFTIQDSSMNLVSINKYKIHQ